MSSVVISGDTSGAITLSAPAVAGTTTLTLPATSGTVLQSGTTVTEAQGGTGTSTGYYGFKNRLINSAMVIDQRNAGASVTPTGGTYTLDRWNSFVTQSSKLTIQQNAGSVTPPVGFTNYLGVTSSSAYSVISSDIFQVSQFIEGYNIADLGYGSATTQTITLSFWVRSSLTGTFGGALSNSAYAYSYPYTYTISTANTWEYKTVTITGATSGTWLTTNGIGIRVYFGLGVGSNNSGSAGSWSANGYASATGATSVVGTSGATWYVTGVQLEKGSTATSFDYRPYGTELALCQRYLPAFSYASGANPYMFAGMITSLSSSSVAWFTCQFPVTTRVPASGITVSSATHFAAFLPSTGTVNATSVSYGGSTSTGGNFNIGGLTGVTAGNSTLLYFNNSSALIYFTGCEL